MKIILYHSGNYIIENPDIHYGRKNADLGQGFYLTQSEDFVRRWSKEKKGMSTYVNKYVLDLENLKVKTLQRDEEWFDYIYNNRNGYEDAYAEYDVIEGPIANDIIYDLLGITTSGVLGKEKAMEILMKGPEYRQLVIKTKKASDALSFMGHYVMTTDEMKELYEMAKAEEEEFQKLVGEIMKDD